MGRAALHNSVARIFAHVSRSLEPRGERGSLITWDVTASEDHPMRLGSWLLLVIPFLFSCGDAGEPVGTAVQPVKVCPGPNTLDGIDVSHYDGTIDWAKVKASGQAFAFIKATE